MVLVNCSAELQGLGKIKKAFWLRLLNKVLPTRLQVSIDYGLTKVETLANVAHVPPSDVNVWALKSPEIVSLDPTHDFGDYMPRYWVRESDWQLTVPTPVGNINLYFEGVKITAAMPKLLEPLVYPSLSSPDLFVKLLTLHQGGSLDDTTLGRTIEGLILKDVNEWVVRLLIVGAGLYAIAHVAMR